MLWTTTSYLLFCALCRINKSSSSLARESYRGRSENFTRLVARDISRHDEPIRVLRVIRAIRLPWSVRSSSRFGQSPNGDRLTLRKLLAAVILFGGGAVSAHGQTPEPTEEPRRVDGVVMHGEPKGPR